MRVEKDDGIDGTLRAVSRIFRHGSKFCHKTWSSSAKSENIFHINKKINQDFLCKDKISAKDP